MISEWSSYSLQDFIPFTWDVYVRLTERVNEAAWPLHLIWLTAGLTCFILPRIRKSRWSAMFFALPWCWVGFHYYHQHYANLNWAGEYLRWLFLLQALLMCGFIWSRNPPRHFAVPQWIGIGLFAGGLILIPLISSAGNIPRAEVFGIHPDPTAITTLGFLLLNLRGWKLWILTILPLVCCLIGGLTLLALDSPRWPVPILTGVLGLTGIIFSSTKK